MVFRVPKRINLSDIKPLIGNISRANYYQVQFGGLSGDLYGYLGARGVSQQFVAEDMGLMCYSASLPGSSLADVQSQNFHGITENFVHSRVYTPLTLSFYCDNEYRGLKFLEHWMEYVVSGNGTFSPIYASPSYNYRMKYPSQYKSQSTKIFKFESDLERVMEYSFIGLFPSNLSSTQVQYGPNSEITRITCSFKYDRYIAGSTYSYDYILGTSNNLISTIRDITGSAADLINRIIN